MKKNLVSQKKVEDFVVQYGLISGNTEIGEVYGVYIEKSTNGTITEREEVFGLTQNKIEIDSFIDSLGNGTALPVELVALCDDFLAEKERKEELEMAC